MEYMDACSDTANAETISGAREPVTEPSGQGDLYRR
jgi:hypothetical protein